MTSGVFSPDSYLSVNREERHFCAVLMHALLASQDAREALSTMLSGRTGVPLDPATTAVFVEAAVLRDYWRALGEWKSYSAYVGGTHVARNKVIQAILALNGIPATIIEQEQMFWTGVPATRCRPL